MTRSHEDAGSSPLSHRGRDMTAGEFGDGAVLNRDLRPEMVPASADPWMPFATFALSFDGYQYRDDLGVWANENAAAFRGAGSLPAGLSLSDLRALVFYEQRRYRHMQIEPPRGDGLRYVDTLLAAIRTRLVHTLAT